MRDFINVDIKLEGVEGNTALWRMSHKVRDLHVSFRAPASISTDTFASLVMAILKRYSEKYSSVTRRPMTPQQKNYYDKLVEFHQMEGRAPSYEEQCLMLGVRSKGTPHHYAKVLEQAGWVWFDGRAVIPYEIAEPNIEDEKNG